MFTLVSMMEEACKQAYQARHGTKEDARVKHGAAGAQATVDEIQRVAQKQGGFAAHTTV